MLFGIEWITIASLSITITFFPIGYALGVYFGHYQALLPFISDTGVYPPEEYIFSIACSLIAFFTFTAVYVRFKHINLIYTTYSAYEKIKCINIIAAVTGFVVALMLNLTGIISEPALFYSHYVISGLFWFIGIVYTWIQIGISIYIKESSLAAGPIVIVIRIILASINTVSSICVVLCQFIAWLRDIKRDTHHLAIEFVLSAFAEWITALTLILLFVTLYFDFIKISLDFNVKPRLKMQY